MGYMSMFKDYRNTLMKALCSSKDIVNLLKNTNEDSPTLPDKSLLYDHIYPYPFIPQADEAAKTYVGVRLTVPQQNIQNHTPYRFHLHALQFDESSWRSSR